MPFEAFIRTYGGPDRFNALREVLRGGVTGDVRTEGSVLRTRDLFSKELDLPFDRWTFQELEPVQEAVTLMASERSRLSETALSWQTPTAFEQLVTDVIANGSSIERFEREDVKRSLIQCNRHIRTINVFGPYGSFVKTSDANLNYRLATWFAFAKEPAIAAPVKANR